MSFSYSANGTLYQENLEMFNNSSMMNQAHDKMLIKYTELPRGPQGRQGPPGLPGVPPLNASFDSISVKDKGNIEFGQGLQKAPYAGRIAYQNWSDGLDIVGGGQVDGSRKVRVHDILEVGKLCVGNKCVDQNSFGGGGGGGDSYNNPANNTGFLTLPGGVLMQWGTIIYNQNNTEVSGLIVFPKTFKDTPYSVTATLLDVSPGNGQFPDNNSVAIGIRFFKKENALWNSKSRGRGFQSGFTWLAIGPAP